MVDMLSLLIFSLLSSALAIDSPYQFIIDGDCGQAGDIDFKDSILDFCSGLDLNDNSTWCDYDYLNVDFPNVVLQYMNLADEEDTCNFLKKMIVHAGSNRFVLFTNSNYMKNQILNGDKEMLMAHVDRSCECHSVYTITDIGVWCMNFEKFLCDFEYYITFDGIKTKGSVSILDNSVYDMSSSRCADFKNSILTGLSPIVTTDITPSEVTRLKTRSSCDGKSKSIYGEFNDDSIVFEPGMYYMTEIFLEDRTDTLFISSTCPVSSTSYLMNYECRCIEVIESVPQEVRSTVNAMCDLITTSDVLPYGFGLGYKTIEDMVSCKPDSIEFHLECMNYTTQDQLNSLVECMDKSINCNIMKKIQEEREKTTVENPIQRPTINIQRTTSTTPVVTDYDDTLVIVMSALSLGISLILIIIVAFIVKVLLTARRRILYLKNKVIGGNQSPIF